MLPAGKPTLLRYHPALPVIVGDRWGLYKRADRPVLCDHHIGGDVQASSIALTIGGNDLM